MTPLPPLPDRSPAGDGLPPLPPRPSEPDGLPPLERPARPVPPGPAVAPAASSASARGFRRPAVPGGRAAAIAAAILAAGVVGGVTGASLADRSGSQTTTTVQATASPPAASQVLPNTATSLTDAVRTASPSVVAVRSSFGQGSGVIVDDRGLVVTNHHVIAGDSTVGIETADGRLVSADVVADDPQQDLAVLRPVDDVGPGATIASEPNGGLVVGDQVFAIGNPFGLRNTVTSGIVSFVDRPADGGTPMIQTDAPINPGNSGGGLFDLRGQLVGIPTSIRAPIQGNVGIGFAVPVSRVSALLRRVQ